MNILRICIDSITSLYKRLTTKPQDDQGMKSIQITQENRDTLYIVARRIQQSRKRAQAKQHGNLITVEFDSVLLSAVEQLKAGNDVQYTLGFENDIHSSTWFTLTASWSINNHAKPSNFKKVERVSVVEDLTV